MKRKVLGVLLSIMMLGTCILAGCGQENGTAAPEDSQPAAESTGAADESTQAGGESALEYGGNDISEHKELVMYVIGDEPVIADEVEAALNEKLEEKLNCSLDISYIALSDYSQKYSLLLASGENIDIIYTSTWAFYYEEATKGAFTEITDELLSKYMPQTTEGQDSMAFEQAKINGKCYMIPKNSPYVNNAMPVLIRGDLREKYGIDKIDSVEKLEEYFTAVAEKE